ncbi:dual oxidase maturation factor 1-like [Patiria miniata]|uniref:Dual oxidase maturation factor 1 n=1 Tax=Patiria miniata TaxID=46514 RepID=A0A914BQJ4_PATMI|nr:dual oxidase maturation factor 1-like [Patiria miniata]
MGTPYSALRNPGSPTAYGPNKTAVSADITYAGLVYAFFILAVSFLAILPGIRKRNRIYAAIRFFLGLFIGFTILLSTYGQDWEVASLKSVTTAYKAFTKDEIVADIGVNIGLTNVNVTLKSIPEYPETGELKGERINFNERFTFCCNQGRRGFGTFAGRINREFRDAQWKGLPYPILWIVEYFTLDGEDIRWGRSYRVAGFYTFMVMWTAFCLWVLALAFSFMVIRYCGIFLVLTGSCLLSSNIIYATVRYGSELVIPFSKDHVLEFSKGGSFYLCLVGGIVSTLVGIAIVILDDIYPFKMAVFFNVDPLQDFQDTFAVTTSSPAENVQGNTGPQTGKDGRPLSVLNEDLRVEALAAEALGNKESEAYKGNMYINVAQMKASFKSGRKSLFQKNKPRRKKKPEGAGSRNDGFDLGEVDTGNTSLLQSVTPAPISFKAKGMGESTTVEDTVATDRNAGLSTTSIRMSEIALRDDVDSEDVGEKKQDDPKEEAS